MRVLLSVCRSRNMKLAPSKFPLGRLGIYGGSVLEAAMHNEDDKPAVYISPTQEKLDVFLNIQSPTYTKDIQRICGLAVQLKRWTPGLMLEFGSVQKLSAASVQFHCNPDLEKELQAMKSAIKNAVKLSPLDVEKDLLMWTDAAPLVGMAYLLGQYKDPEDETKGVNIVS